MVRGWCARGRHAIAPSYPGRSHLATPTSNRAGRTLLIAYANERDRLQVRAGGTSVAARQPVFSGASRLASRGVPGYCAPDIDHRDARQRAGQHQRAEPGRISRRIRRGGGDTAGVLRGDECDRQSVDRQGAHPVGDSRRHPGCAGAVRIRRAIAAGVSEPRVRDRRPARQMGWRRRHSSR